MLDEFNGDRSRRRYQRVTGPFDGCRLGVPDTAVLIYDLNLGGCFVNSMHEQLEGSALLLKIDLLQEGWITVNAETLYRHQFGFAVRFVEIGEESAARLVRTVDAMRRAL